MLITLITDTKTYKKEGKKIKLKDAVDILEIIESELKSELTKLDLVNIYINNQVALNDILTDIFDIDSETVLTLDPDILTNCFEEILFAVIECTSSNKVDTKATTTSNNDNQKITEVLFDNVILISKEFNTSPFDIYNLTFREFLNFIKKLNKYYEQPNKKNQSNQVTRIPAGDDWF